jgi:hypothetical protein
MHWPCGPLPAAGLAAKKTLTAELKETLAAWADPKALDILQGSPVNCLVIPWAEGTSEDKNHQQVLEALIRAGRERKISLVGTITGKQDVGAAISSAMQAGLAALMVESLEGLPKDAPVILRTPRSGVPWESVTPVFCLTGNIWPRLGLDTVKNGDDANAGPTGVPWVNSNGWLAMLARQLSPGKNLWLECDPPESSDLDHPAGYALAVADCRAFGSRWVISLDDHLRRGLTQRDPRATGIWEKISSTLKFFQANETWSGFEPQGVLAVVSDFRGDNEFMATEVLNLLSRRQLQYKIVEKSAAPSVSLHSLKAVLWVDSVEPSAAVKSRFRGFVEQGGLLIAPKLWWPLKSSPTSGGILGHYRVYRIGRGSHAVPAEEMVDPYEISVDAHMLMSRRNDLVRVFNVSACNALLTTDAQSGKQLVQVLNYASAGRPDLASVWVRTASRSAKLWALGAAEPVTLRGVPSRVGWEYELPFIPTYAALEFEVRGV